MSKSQMHVCISVSISFLFSDIVILCLHRSVYVSVCASALISVYVVVCVCISLCVSVYASQTILIKDFGL